MHSAQPFGGKPKLMILISDKNGSAISSPFKIAALRSAAWIVVTKTAVTPRADVTMQKITTHAKYCLELD